jgi:hypothetical protein
MSHSRQMDGIAAGYSHQGSAAERVSQEGWGCQRRDRLVEPTRICLSKRLRRNNIGVFWPKSMGEWDDAAMFSLLGFVHLNFDVHSNKLKLARIATPNLGARNLLQPWCHCFEGSNYVYFVPSNSMRRSHFDERLFSDPLIDWNFIQMTARIYSPRSQFLKVKPRKIYSIALRVWWCAGNRHERLGFLTSTIEIRPCNWSNWNERVYEVIVQDAPSLMWRKSTRG